MNKELNRLRQLPTFSVIHRSTREVRECVEEHDDYFLSLNENYPKANRFYPFLGIAEPPAFSLQKPYWQRDEPVRRPIRMPTCRFFKLSDLNDYSDYPCPD